MDSNWQTVLDYMIETDSPLLAGPSPYFPRSAAEECCYGDAMQLEQLDRLLRLLGGYV